MGPLLLLLPCDDDDDVDDCLNHLPYLHVSSLYSTKNL